MVNVISLKGPDMFAEFGRVSVFCVLERCGVVSVSIVLKSFSVSLMYVSVVVLSSRATVAW